MRVMSSDSVPPGAERRRRGGGGKLWSGRPHSAQAPLSSLEGISISFKLLPLVYTVSVPHPVSRPDKRYPSLLFKRLRSVSVATWRPVLSDES